VDAAEFLAASTVRLCELISSEVTDYTGYFPLYTVTQPERGVGVGTGGGQSALFRA
jgi:hypothetical protein